MKNKTLDIFFSEQDTEKAIEELKKLFLKHTVPIRPNRKIHRNNKKRRKKVKRKVTKNRANAHFYFLKVKPLVFNKLHFNKIE